MAVLEWTEEMSVGLAQLDDDHKQLIAIINRLAEGAEGQISVVRQCLLALRRYAEFHFTREERVMRACEYPVLATHAETHKAFIARIQAESAAFEADPEGSVKRVRETLIRYLKDWLVNHILQDDMAYRAHVENNPAAEETARNFRGVEIWWSS